MDDEIEEYHGMFALRMVGARLHRLLHMLQLPIDTIWSLHPDPNVVSTKFLLWNNDVKAYEALQVLAVKSPEHVQLLRIAVFLCCLLVLCYGLLGGCVGGTRVCLCVCRVLVGDTSFI